MRKIVLVTLLTLTVAWGCSNGAFITDETPGNIIIGQTTRAWVLGKIGEPQNNIKSSEAVGKPDCKGNSFETFVYQTVNYSQLGEENISLEITFDQNNIACWKKSEKVSYQVNTVNLKSKKML